ncbi:MAG: ABC transporter substrate-binding protein [Chloroflexota bacterium]
MQTRKLFLMTCCLMVLGLLLASCAPAVAPTATPKPAAATSKGAAPTPKPAAPAATAKPAAPTLKPSSGQFPIKDEPGKAGGILRIIKHAATKSLDPHQEISINDLSSCQNLYNQLIQYNPFNPNEIISDLAKTWEISSDGKTITFHLREGVAWHDGKPFTSADAQFSINRMMNPPKEIRSPRKTMFVGVEKLEGPDAHTFKIVLKEPRASFLANIASGWYLMMPKHVLEEKGPKACMDNPVGTGPFKLKKWTRGVSTELVKNDKYFIKDRPYLDGVTVHLIADSSTRFAALRAGQVQMTNVGSNGLLPEQYKTVKESPELSAKIEAIKYPGLLMPYFIFNLAKKPWNDVRVRRAAHLAFDRQAMIKAALDFGEIGVLMNPSGPWGTSEEESSKIAGFRQPKDADIAEAKRLLADAGYASGFETKVLLRSAMPMHEAMTTLLLDGLSKIGIRGTMDTQETGTYTETSAKGAFEIVNYVYGRPIDDPDPVILEQFVTGAGRNLGGYSDKTVDSLAQEQTRTIDPAGRKTIVKKIQDRLLETCPVLFCYWVTNGYGKLQTVHNYHPGIGNFNNFRYENVWLEQ